MDVVEILRRVTLTPGISGWEDPARDEITAILRELLGDVSFEVDDLGNLYAKFGVKPKVALIAHMDELGFTVRSIDDRGYLYVDAVGGWDDRVLLGSAVVVYGSGRSLEGLDWRGRAVLGVFGSKPIHMLKPDEREKAPKLHDMFVDIGVSSRSEAEDLVRVGDVGHVQKGFNFIPREGSSKVSSRGFDDRAGCTSIILASKILAEAGVSHYAVFTVQEEVGTRGATTAGYKLHEEGVRLAVAVDVTHASGYPGLEEKEYPIKVGLGGVIARGPPIPYSLSKTFEDQARACGVPYQIGPESGKTRTDLDVIQLARTGLRSMLISIPLKYMHTGVEVVDVKDVESAANIIAHGVLGSLREI